MSLGESINSKSIKLLIVTLSIISTINSNTVLSIAAINSNNINILSLQQVLSATRLTRLEN